MKFESVCALMYEAKGTLPEQVRKLTPYQTEHIIFHERTEHGAIIPRVEGDTEAPGDEERLRAKWRREWGITEAEAGVKWVEFLRCEAFRAHLEQKAGATPEKVEARVAEHRRRLESQRPPFRG